jgi:very-short-patch-repair endonuclease
MLPYDKTLQGNSRELRRTMTRAERIVWSRIRRKQIEGLQFYRQKIIGRYIVDFYCPRARVIVEVDGGQHYGGEGLKSDGIRDSFMKNLGIQTLRISDADVLKNIDEVVLLIWNSVRSSNPPVSPFSKGGKDMEKENP